MRLTGVDIEGYRAIDRLHIDLASVTTVIGEPDCGKSSLLRAIVAVLGAQAGEDEAPTFERTDFHRPAGEETRATRLRITLWLRADAGDLDLAPGLVPPRGEGALRVRSERLGSDAPTTSIEVLDEDGRLVPDMDATRLLTALRRRHPAAIVGRPRMTAGLTSDADTTHPAAIRLRELIRGASEPAEPLTWEQLANVRGDLVHAAARLAAQLPPLPDPPRSIRLLADAPLLETDLARALGPDAGASRRIPALWLLVAIIQALPPEGLAGDAEPILLFDDIEADLHPTWLASLCSVAINLPFQVVVTTHSPAVLSWMPLSSLRRLTRGPRSLEARAVNIDALSDEDLRRLAYHVRANRGGAFFARCWVLVEGETEAWLVPEFARLSGVEMPVEGIRCVEFAQCGLDPLLRVADDLGIRWVVLTDGDPAGQHYASTARRHLDGSGAGTVIVLPDVDIEHYLYRNGYGDVFARAARRGPSRRPGPVIAAAVDNVSKPGLALQVLTEADRRGPEGVPPVLRQLADAALASAHSPG